MNGEARPEAGATADNQADGSTTVTELLAAVRRERDAALADGEGDDPFWAVVGAALVGALTWEKASRAITAIETTVVGRCRYCSGRLIERADCPPPTYTCLDCGRLWPWSLQYNPPPEHFVEILGDARREEAS